jgi:hypothetical protein
MRQRRYPKYPPIKRRPIKVKPVVIKLVLPFTVSMEDRTFSGGLWFSRNWVLEKTPIDPAAIMTKQMMITAIVTGSFIFPPL